MEARPLNPRDYPVAFKSKKMTACIEDGNYNKVRSDDIVVVGHSHARRLGEFFTKGDADWENSRRIADPRNEGPMMCPTFGTGRFVHYDAQGGDRLGPCKARVAKHPSHAVTILWIGENDLSAKKKDNHKSLTPAEIAQHMVSIAETCRPNASFGVIVMPLLRHINDCQYNEWAGEVNDSLRDLLYHNRRDQIMFCNLQGRVGLARETKGKQHHPPGWCLCHARKGTKQDIHLAPFGYACCYKPISFCLRSLGLKA